MPRGPNPLHELVALDDDEHHGYIDDGLDQFGMTSLHDYPEHDTATAGAKKAVEKCRDDWQIFIEAVYHPQLRRCSSRDETDDEDLLIDTFDFTADHEVSLRRAKGFLWLFVQTSLAQDPPPTIATLKRKKFILSRMMQDEIAAQAPKGKETAAVSSLFGDTSKYGFVKRLTAACNTIIAHFDLQHAGVERPIYGREEYNLICLALIKRLVEQPEKAQETLAYLCAMSIAYVTGFRGGTLVGMRTCDISFTRLLSSEKATNPRRHAPAWICNLWADTFKAKTPMTVSPEEAHLPPVERYENILIEPALFLLLLLLVMGLLEEKGGKRITSVDELEQSEAFELVGVGTGPLFCRADGTPMTTSDLSSGIRAAAKTVGLQSGGLHCFRRDLATEIDIAMNSEKGQLALNHDQCSTEFHRGYTSGINQVPLMAIRSGEHFTPQQQERLEQSGFFLKGLNRAATSIASSVGAGALSRLRLGDFSNSAAQSRSQPSARARPPLDYQAKLQLALQRSDTLTSMLAAFAQRGRRIVSHVPGKVRYQKHKVESFDQFSGLVLSKLASSLGRLQQQQPLPSGLLESVARAQRAATQIAALVTDLTKEKKKRSAKAQQGPTTTRSVLESRAAIQRLQASTKETLSTYITDEGSGRGDAWATSNVRLGLMRQIFGVTGGHKRFRAVVEHISDALVCGACWRNHDLAPPAHALFPGPSTHIEHVSPWMDNRRRDIANHLHNFHGSLADAILRGEQVNLGSFANGLPFWFPSLVQQYAPDVAALSLVPAQSSAQLAPIPIESPAQALPPLSSLRRKHKAPGQATDSLLPTSWTVRPPPQRFQAPKMERKEHGRVG